MLRVILLALVLFTSLASAEEAAVVRYVGGTSADLTAEPVFRDGRIGGGCAGSPTVPVHAGGACRVPLAPGAWRVEVVDDVVGPIGFTWTALDERSVACGEGAARSGEVVVLAPSCVALQVFVPLGSTTGTIAVARA